MRGGSAPLTPPGGIPGADTDNLCVRAGKELAAKRKTSAYIQMLRCTGVMATVSVKYANALVFVRAC